MVTAWMGALAFGVRHHEFCPFCAVAQWACRWREMAGRGAVPVAAAVVRAMMGKMSAQVLRPAAMGGLGRVAGCLPGGDNGGTGRSSGPNRNRRRRRFRLPGGLVGAKVRIGFGGNHIGARLFCARFLRHLVQRVAYQVVLISEGVGQHPAGKRPRQRPWQPGEAEGLQRQRHYGAPDAESGVQGDGHAGHQRPARGPLEHPS